MVLAPLPAVILRLGSRRFLDLMAAGYGPQGGRTFRKGWKVA